MRCNICTHLGYAIVFSDRRVYRCSRGHYDQADGTPVYYAWSGISGPNKAVKEIENNCTDFAMETQHETP